MATVDTTVETPVETSEAAPETNTRFTGAEEAAPQTQRTVTVSRWITKVYKGEEHRYNPARTETFDIGEENSPLNVMGYDVYVQGTLLSNMGEKRTRYTDRIMRDREALRELGKHAGKAPVCSQCKTSDGIPNCTWHTSAIIDVQQRLEEAIRGYASTLKSTDKK